MRFQLYSLLHLIYGQTGRSITKLYKFMRFPRIYDYFERLEVGFLVLH